MVVQVIVDYAHEHTFSVELGEEALVDGEVSESCLWDAVTNHLANLSLACPTTFPTSPTLTNSLPTCTDELVLCFNIDPTDPTDLTASDVLYFHHELTSLTTDLLYLQLHPISNLTAGKGGFGAQLRILAKQRGKKQTTNFSACRDLNGRRLRHINDEIILQKWQSAKDNGEDFDTDQDTGSGIQLWFLSTPSWAEGIKNDSRKKFMKPRYKTMLCMDWIRAREPGKRPPPSNAANHWGCPRGRKCNFAHGEEELVGKWKDKLEVDNQAAKEQAKQQAKDAYFQPLYDASQRLDDNMEAVVKMGLESQQKKKTKVQETETQIVKELSDESQDWQDLLKEVTQEVREEIHDENVESEGFVELLSGSAVIRYNHVVLEETTAVVGTTTDSPALNVAASSSSSSSSANTKRSTPDEDSANLVAILTGNSKFSTAMVKTCQVQLGHWYYEIELLSDGLMQLGWATSDFIGGNNDEGNGVGDDIHSWGYDGLRQKLFHAGKEQDGQVVDGEQVSWGWTAGDVVGCLLSITPCQQDMRYVEISFQLNGKTCGTGFQYLIGSKEEVKWYPAFSLEDNESILVNVGHAPFRFPPSAAASASSSVSPDATGRSYQGICQHAQASVDMSSIELSEDIWKALQPKTASKRASQSTVDTKQASSTEAIASTSAEAEQSFEPITLEAAEYATQEALEALGLDRLKFELQKRGLKVGGTLAQRAERLLSVRGVKPSKINKKLLASK